MNAVDTNVLLYAQDPRDKHKQAKAQLLLANLVDGVLLWQVACEYLAAARKLMGLGFSYSEALANVQDLRVIWKEATPAWPTHERAVQLIKQYSLSFWDALLLAACAEAGVTCLYSEDLGSMSYKQIEGVELVNPFK
jgi:predicted nucleic acid-binding protein